MLIRAATDIRPSDITKRSDYVNRRTLLAGTGAALAGAFLPSSYAWADRLAYRSNPDYALNERPTSRADVTQYNNFYEYGISKEQPAERAPGRLKLRPWTVTVGGECAKPATVDVEDLIKTSQLEERIYRHRCVEGWSMVIPWLGVPLASVLRRFEPTSKAAYVAFQTLHDPSQMPEQSSTYLPYPWPYREGVRLDEAMHPLTLLAVGLYGESLPAQNGAPLRLVVPWKYGFKSIKSIVRMDFVQEQPPTFWNSVAPNEYRFYSNVNPDVDNPRWSQATERRIGEFRRRPTLMFNGYGAQVAQLYAGMDLQINF